MLSASINVYLIFETSIVALNIEKKSEELLGFCKVVNVDFMNNLIAGSFG